MKKSLMMSTAVVVLVAGTSLAAAQMERKPSYEGQETKSSTEQKAAPRAETKSKAQVSQDLKAQSDQKLNASPSEKSGAEIGTTGQAGAKTDVKSGSETSGQAGVKTEMKSGSDKPSAQSQSAKPSGSEASGAAKTDSSAQGSGTASSAPAKTGAEGSVSTTGSAASAVNLSSEQKIKIREVLTKRSDAPRVSSVNFSLNIGTAIPRTVRIRALPVEIVQIYPAWRGYDYFLVGDEIVVVDPRTLRIVAIIAA